MKVEIKYFASLREDSKIDSEIVETNAKTAKELFVELDNKYNFKQGIETLKVAINESYVPFSTKLSDLDIIVFIPPVAGG